MAPGQGVGQPQQQFRYTQTPSKVLHLRNLPWECTEEELVVLCKPFGRIVNTMCNVGANKNQAFVEFIASGGIGSGIGNYISGDSNVAAQSKLKKVSVGDIIVNAKCKLLHWFVDGAVAEGRIVSTDPKVKVDHVPLGGSY